MDTHAEFHRAWKEANGKVREAEDQLHTAWQTFAAGQSGPPDKALLDEVTRLRRECDQRLSMLLQKPGKERPGA